MAFRKDRDDNMWLTRGDNLDLDVKNLTYKDENGQKQIYVFEEGDRVFFRLQTPKMLRTIELVVNLETNKAHLAIVPEDTNDIPFGIYKYEVEVVTSENKHYTFKADKNFTVDRELEDHNNG